MPSVFLQGDFLSPADARVSAFDAGFQHAVGLFETMTAVVDPALNIEAGADTNTEAHIAQRTRVVHQSAHTARLLTSCIELGLTSQLRAAPLEEAILRTVARTHQTRVAAHASDASLQSQPQRYRVRCTITGGDLNLLARTPASSARTAQEPTILIAAQPATSYPAAMFEQGVPAIISELRISPLDATSSHKTLNYWARLRELQRASSRGASEALVLDVTNHLVGGCVSSIILVKNGSLHLPPARGELLSDEAPQASSTAHALASAGIAPPTRTQPRAALANDDLPSCVLPGITRDWVLQWADDELIDVHLRPITMADVLEADEVILTNSSWGVLPIIAIESHTIAARTKHPAKPGPIARTLHTHWLTL